MRTLVHCDRCLQEVMSGEKHEAVVCLRRLRMDLHAAQERVHDLHEVIEVLVVEDYRETVARPGEGGEGCQQ